jgi:hypothetical protein
MNSSRYLTLLALRDVSVLYRDPDYCVKGMIAGLQMAVGFPYFRLPSRISLDTGTPIGPIFSRSRSTRSIKALFGFRFSPAIRAPFTLPLSPLLIPLAGSLLVSSQFLATMELGKHKILILSLRAAERSETIPPT